LDAVLISAYNEDLSGILQQQRKIGSHGAAKRNGPNSSLMDHGIP